MNLNNLTIGSLSQTIYNLMLMGEWIHLPQLNQKGGVNFTARKNHEFSKL